eukprot:12923351-Prorocentrum_lima.AAC.1
MFKCRQSFIPLKTLFGDNAALTEYMEQTTDELLVEYIAVTGIARVTGVVGAAPQEVPVEVAP